MKHIIKTLGLMSLVATIYGANAATSRVSMTPARRVPSAAGWLVSSGTSTVATASTSTFSDTECIDAYTSCLKDADVCGPNMEECTTKVLLHAKMPNCLSTLYQCSSAGINSLFGTSSVTALGSGEVKNNYGDITNYTYPTDGSVLGQLVKGAYLSNLLPKDQCVKKYMNCVKRDNVCGADFELCTTKAEFKRQSLTCSSTYARCQSEGLKELFGSENGSPSNITGGMIDEAISEGAALAAVQAVSTCYKVADQCILKACGANPVRCKLDSDTTLAAIVDAINAGEQVNIDLLREAAQTVTSRDIAGYLRNACLDTIGGNKYCYATFLGNGAMPTNAQIQDEDNRAEIFDEAYTARMNNSMKQKIQDLLDRFDKDTKNKCVNTIKSCAMRHCGGGVGSVCYKKVFVDDRTDQTEGKGHINRFSTYSDIENGCAPVVNTDTSCLYASAAINNNTYTYTYTDNSVFGDLFPPYSNGFADPINAVATLDALLASSYNEAAIEQMKKQCQTTALGCVRSMCGKDYVNCYRNRTDIIGGTYDTTNNKFNRSMNKMGGILDYNIVIGLCLNTVKTSAACEEHLKIAAADWRDNEDTTSWASNKDGDQYDTVRDAWRGANDTKISTKYDATLIACAISAEEAQSKSDSCTVGDRMTPVNNSCDGLIDEDGCIYSEKVFVSNNEYALTKGAETLFSELLADVETEVQAKYNAKLTKEQNMCYANNAGGIKGTDDLGSTFQWVKLRGNKVPSNYASKGLSSKEFTTSNDLYGSFCRARITVMSDDKAIQDVLGGSSVAYFAVGDPFTCGSWISQKKLEEVSGAVAKRAAEEAGKGSKKDQWAKRWWEIGGLTLGGLGGFAGMDAIQRKGGTLGGILSPKNNGYVTTEKKNEAGETCLKELDSAEKDYALFSVQNYKESEDAYKAYNSAITHANKALAAARSANADVSNINFTPMYGHTPNTAATKGVYKWDESDDRKIKNYVHEIGTVYGHYCETNTCQYYLTQVTDILNKAPTTEDYVKKETPKEGVVEYKEDSAKVKELVEEIQKYLGDARNAAVSKAESAKGQNAAKAKDALKEMSFNDVLLRTVEVEAPRDAVEPDMVDEDYASTNFETNVANLRNACTDMKRAQEDTSGRLTKNLVAGGVGMLAGGMLTHAIVENYYDVKYENAENKAVKEWMDNVGSHIKCYLGGEELGSYGDVISFELN